MPKIVILGSMTLGDYEVLSPHKIDPELYKTDHDAAYEKAKKIFHPAMAEADIIIALVPDTSEIGEHTKKDIGYAMSLGKGVILVTEKDVEAARTRADLTNRLKAPHDLKWMWLL